jgi:uncharacterized protein (DUF433 family)
MDWKPHIERVPGVMLSKPIFRDTRITVEFVLERLAQGARPEDLVRSHPPLTMDHIPPWHMRSRSCARTNC